MKKIILIGSEGVLGSYYKKYSFSRILKFFLVAGDKQFLKSKTNSEMFFKRIIDLEDPSIDS